MLALQQMALRTPYEGRRAEPYLPQSSPHVRHRRRRTAPDPFALANGFADDTSPDRVTERARTCRAELICRPGTDQLPPTVAAMNEP